MKRILILGGDIDSAKKIAQLEFAKFNNSSFDYVYPYMNPLDTNLLAFNNKFEEIHNDLKISTRASVKFVYCASKYFFVSKSFRIHLRVMLIGNYKLTSKQGLALTIRNFFRVKIILYLLASVYGFFRLPEKLLNLILRFNLNQSNIFQNILKESNANIIVLISSGRDNMHFLMSTFRKRRGISYVMLIQNWDGPSSKNFISSKFDYVGLWNEQQLEHLKSLIDINKETFKIIGSPTCDTAYSEYDSTRVFKDSINTSKKLLYIGQRNNYDELSDVIQIQEFLRTNNCAYSKLAYRPHPNSEMKAKRIESRRHDFRDLEILDSGKLNLLDYSGIICLPTTFLLEVILSAVPAILYAPTDNLNFRNPRKMLQYKHFSPIINSSWISITKDFNTLLSYLPDGLPAQSKPDQRIFDILFPKFSDPYAMRVNNMLENLISEL
jgi:hypothetical protein